MPFSPPRWERGDRSGLRGLVGRVVGGVVPDPGNGVLDRVPEVREPGDLPPTTPPVVYQPPVIRVLPPLVWRPVRGDRHEGEASGPRAGAALAQTKPLGRGVAAGGPDPADQSLLLFLGGRTWRGVASSFPLGIVCRNRSNGSTSVKLFALMRS